MSLVQFSPQLCSPGAPTAMSCISYFRRLVHIRFSCSAVSSSPSATAAEESVPCLWQVSSSGRVKSPTGYTHYGCLKHSGYRSVHIQRQHYQVHRIVASAFLGPPTEDRWQVNHRDGNPSNNALSNLSYVTPSENTRHSWAINPDRRSIAWCGKPVLWRECGETSWSYCASHRNVAMLLGVESSSVSACSRGVQQRTHQMGDGTSLSRCQRATK